MFRKYVCHDVTWYDFKNPRSGEFLDVANGYNLDKEIIKKFLAPQETSEAFVQGDVIFLSLFFPCDLDKETSTITKKQVRFILGKEYIFTARADDIRGFYDFKKTIKINKTNAIDSNNPTSTAPLTELLTQVYKHIGEDLHGLKKSLHHAEKHILASKDISKEAIYEINKKAADLHEVLETQQETWYTFDALCREFFDDPDTNQTLSTIVSKYDKTYSQSERTVAKRIDHKLLFKRALTRKKRIRRLQLIAFVIVLVSLLLAASQVA